MKQFNIKLPEDVARFFFWLVFERRVNIHPDDSIDLYINTETKGPTFTPAEASYYEKVRLECFEVCDKYDVNIYDIGMRVLNLFYFCDKNETMEQLSRPE